MAYGKTAGTGRLVAGKNSSEARSEKGEKLILKACLGKHKAMPKLLPIPCIGDVPAAPRLSGLVFARSSVAVQILKKNNVSLMSLKCDILWLHSRGWETHS